MFIAITSYLMSPFVVSLCVQYYHTFKSQPSTVVSLVFHSFVILFVLLKQHWLLFYFLTVTIEIVQPDANVSIGAGVKAGTKPCSNENGSRSVVSSFENPWTAVHQVSLSDTNSRSLLKPMSIKLVVLSNHLTLCRPLLLLPPIPLGIRAFSNESTLRMRWPKYHLYQVTAIIIMF